MIVATGIHTNLRLHQFSNRHGTEITKTLHGLRGKGMLQKEGHGRWASYRLADKLREVDSEQRGATSTQTGEAPHITKVGSTQSASDPRIGFLYPTG